MMFVAVHSPGLVIGGSRFEFGNFRELEANNALLSIPSLPLRTDPPELGGRSRGME